MSDSAHNAIVTIILIIALVIVALLFLQWYRGGSTLQYRYYPASATIVAPTPSAARTDTVISYSRGSTPIRSSTGSTTTERSTTYQTSYVYHNTPEPQVHYYGTGYTIPSYGYPYRHY